MRRAAAFLFVATAACGVIGSTTGYAGMFCDTLDAATVFCDSFDTTPSPWTVVDNGNKIKLATEEGPKTAPVSPPNVLHVLADGGARSNRWRHVLVPTSFANGSATCAFDFETLATPTQPVMIVWLEIEDPMGIPLFGVGAQIGVVAGKASGAAGACNFMADAGVACASGPAHAFDPGWHHVVMSFTGLDAGVSSVTFELDDKPLSVMPNLAIPFATTLALSVGIAGDQPVTGADLLIDNVFCQ